MKYELSKILRDKRMSLILIGLVLLNALLFWKHCSDFPEMRETYAQGDSLNATQEALRKEQDSIWNEVNETGIQPDYERLDAITEQLKHNQIVLDRIAPVTHYHENREKLIEESVSKVRLGICGDISSFSAQSLLRGAQDYTNLENVNPVPVYLGGAEAILSFPLTELFLFVFMLFPALSLFTAERGSGLRMLTQPTKNGHLVLFLRKVGPMLLTAVGYLVLYGINLMIAGAVLGISHWQVPVQSLYGYANCHRAITVAQAVAEIFALRFLWAMAILSVILLFSTLTGSAVCAVGGIALCGILTATLQMIPNHWLRTCSLFGLSRPEKFYQGAIYLNLVGIPVSRIPVALIFLVVVSLSAGVAGGLVFCKGSCQENRTRKGIAFARKRYSVHLVLQETEKALIHRKGLLILLAALLLQIAVYRDYHGIYGVEQQYYRLYSMELQGAPSEEKTQYLARESKKYTDIQNRLRMGNLTSAERRELTEQQRGQIPFEEAKQQYERLQTGQSYLYQTGYTELFAPWQGKEDLLNFGKLLFITVLLTAEMFAMEQESGLSLLQMAYGQERKTGLYKAIICAGYAVVLSIIVFLPKYIAVFHTYGGFLPFAQANSIQWFSTYPDWLSVLGVILLQFGLRICLAALAFGIVGFLSQKYGNTILTMEISFPLLLLPVAVGLFLLRGI